MTKLPFHVAIVALMIAGCIGPRRRNIQWPGDLDQRLLNIFYAYNPPKDRPWEDVKREWSSQLPHYSGLSTDRLKTHVHDLMDHFSKEWQKRPDDEREQVDDILANIYIQTGKNQSNHPKLMLDSFLKCYPRYTGEPELMRTVVYRWYDRYDPLGKVIMASDVDWTRGRNDFLLNAIKQAQEEQVDVKSRIKHLWKLRYKYLNVQADSLFGHVYSLMNRKESELEKRVRRKEENVPGEEKTKGKKTPWNDETLADLYYINSMIRPLDVTHGAAMKDRWDRMQKKYTHLGAHSLLNKANSLKNYTPELKNLREAIKKYEKLPPLPTEVYFKRQGTWRGRSLRIREIEESKQQQENEPVSSSVRLTPETLAHLHLDMAEIDLPYAGHPHYSHQTHFYGGSSHNPTEQGPFRSLPDIPRPQHHQWFASSSNSHNQIHQDRYSSQQYFPHPHEYFRNPDSSSSHTPFHQVPFGLPPHTPYSHQDFSSPRSSGSHTLIHEDSSGLITVTSHPRHREPDDLASSSYTPIHQEPSGSLPHTPYPHQDSLSQGDSSSHTFIHEDPSGLITVTSRPQSRQPDYRGNSSHTSVHRDSSRLQPDTPRPNRHQWIPGSDSRHYQYPPQ